MQRPIPRFNPESLIFGIGVDGKPPFENQLLSSQAITVYFAVIDLVAAVSQLLLGFFFPRLLPITPVLIGTYVGLIAAYFLAIWAAENERS